LTKFHDGSKIQTEKRETKCITRVSAKAFIKKREKTGKESVTEFSRKYIRAFGFQ